MFWTQPCCQFPYAHHICVKQLRGLSCIIICADSISSFFIFSNIHNFTFILHIDISAIAHISIPLRVTALGNLMDMLSFCVGTLSTSEWTLIWIGCRNFSNSFTISTGSSQRIHEILWKLICWCDLHTQVLPKWCGNFVRSCELNKVPHNVGNGKRNAIK